MTTTTITDERYADVFSHYQRRGAGKLSDAELSLLAERRAQAAGTAAGGGYFVPQGYWLRMTQVLKEYGGLLAEANTVTTDTGQIIPWPTNNDTAT
jgi:HK97 family phage major capsid protein